jgi:GLPGLI family protein
MEKIYIYIICLFSTLSFGQKIIFEPTMRVTYAARLQLGEKYNHNQKFILLGNSQDYYFAAAQNYLNDTGQYEVKGIDTRSISDYFQERLIRSNNKTTVFITIIDSKVRYEEGGLIKWVLYSDTKIINGVKCQMAATNKYGRRWIAYFSKDYPQSLGPYKFNGLPGLIFELYDIRDDYHFTLEKVEKYTDAFAFNLNEYKNYPKDKYLKAKYNLEFTLAGYPADMDEELRKELQNAYNKKRIMYNNPLELKPFE